MKEELAKKDFVVEGISKVWVSGHPKTSGDKATEPFVFSAWLVETVKGAVWDNGPRPDFSTSRAKERIRLWVPQLTARDGWESVAASKATTFDKKVLKWHLGS